MYTAFLAVHVFYKSPLSRAVGMRKIFVSETRDNSTRRGLSTFSVWHSLMAYCSICHILWCHHAKYNVSCNVRGLLWRLENIYDIFLSEIHTSLRYEKNKQVPMLNPDRQSLISGETISYSRLVFVTSYHPWPTFVSLDPILVLDSINQALLSFGSTAI